MNHARRSSHTFHIPVMGTGFMIDAPLRVAKYGISSVISLVDDVLIEQVRCYHCEKEHEPYAEIADADEDSRARRITEYLNLLDRLVRRQVELLQASPFEAGSEITRYYELLPESALQFAYRKMLATADPRRRAKRQSLLRRLAVPGSIDVNIMCKLDRDRYRNGQKLPAHYSDASAALRGFANSTLASSIVFSAGMNPRLYSYAAAFDDFLPDGNGGFKKKIILKVSDFHSASIQARYLARRGLWVSEFRIESGLNCGGHAFATRGNLLGPILEEFQRKRTKLAEQLFAAYGKALAERGRTAGSSPPEVRLTVQGGIGTAEEDALLREHYGAEGTGWGTPFLLVPEVTNVDDEHLEKLSAAREEDVFLSDSSPLGMPFWNLRNSASEEARRRRIAKNMAGSSCSKGYGKLSNSEFTEIPICTASRHYQQLKLRQLDREELPEEERAAKRRQVQAKSCICHDLAGGATVKYGIDPAATTAVCCGPNIVNFSKIATLEEMVGHIYGRGSLVTRLDRPHMFLREIALYLDYLRADLERHRSGNSPQDLEYFHEFKKNLLEGIGHYQRLASHFPEATRFPFLEKLSALRRELTAILPATIYMIGSEC
jgi:hypothetical protein